MNDGRPQVKLLTRATIAAAALLTALNAYICRDLFHTEYLHQMDSIEGSYIALSRYILAHPHDLKWFPLWYSGIPFQNTYPPLLHMLVAGTAWIFSISPALAHHVVGALFYCLGPVALMFLAYALSNDLALSFVSALAASLLSPTTFLMPSVRVDIGSLWHARRLQTLVHYGDGPHVSSITLVLIALLALHVAIERGGGVRTLAAAVAVAAVVLTNWLGAFSLAIGSVCYLLARLDGDSGQGSKWVRTRTLAYAAAIGLLAYGLAAPWIPPSTILAVQRNAQFTVGSYPMGVRQLEYAVLLLAAGVGLRFILVASRASLCIRFASYFFLVTAALALPSEWFHVYLMPQPERYQLEMELAACLLLVFVPGHYARTSLRKYRVAVVVVLLIFGAIQARTYSRWASGITHSIDIKGTLEYESAQWLQANLPNRRVFAQGSVRYWLDAFSETPQTGGGFDQGLINPEVPITQFGIPFTKGDGVQTAMWLRVLGANGVVVGGPASRDSYPGTWRDPDKFRGVLPELWRSGDDVIYGVPQRPPSLAHVILPADVVPRMPINVEDTEPVQNLSAALENPSLPVADLAWKSEAEAAISATLQPQDLVFVQISYHPGWRATVNGAPRPIRRDGLGFLIIEPECSGPCPIRLLYDGGTEMRVAEWVRGITALVLLIACAWPLWARSVGKAIA